MNIVPKLNQNKHPKDCTNLSLVDAKNIMFDVDQNVLCNENKLHYLRNIINYAKTVLANYNISDDTIYTTNIVGSINCNKEIIYFVSYYVNEDSNNKRLILIREFNVLENFNSNVNMPSSNYSAYLYEAQLDYHDGEIVGTFTYNRNNELIIAFSEYKEDNSLNEPLRTFNLDANTEKTHTLSLIPEVIIPKVTNFEYINDNWYKGQNYLFIRFKINDYDYTQWYDLHKMIYTDYWYNMDFINTHVKLMKYDSDDTPVDDYESKHFNFYTTHSNRLDICSLSFNFSLNSIDLYDKYQIGIINTRKDNTTAYVSSDIDSSVTNVVVSPKNFKTTDNIAVSELIYTYFNYYNVKEVVNFKNKLFISNYKENNQEISSDILNNISIKVEKKSTVEEGALDVSSYDFSRTEQIDVGYLNGKNTDNYNSPFRLYELDNNCYEAYDTLLAVWEDYKAYVHLSWVPYVGSSVGLTYINQLNNTIILTNNIDDNTIVTVRTSDNRTYTDILGRFALKMSSLTNGQFYYLKPVEEIRTIGNTNKKVYRNTALGTVIEVTINNINYTYRCDNLYPWVSKVNGGTSREYYAFDVHKYNLAINYDRIYNSVTSQLKFKTLIPGERYNFYIHFVDKYGIASNGYKINNFYNNGIIDKIFNTHTGDFYFKIIDHSYSNVRDINNSTILFPKYELSVDVPELPDNYIGWYITYEEFEYSIAYNGVVEAKETNLFISNEVDINDSINMNFNTIATRDSELDKTNVELLVGGSVSMLGSNTKLRLNNSEASYTSWISPYVPLVEGSARLANNFVNVKLVNKDNFSYYNTKFKKLIPLTEVTYNSTNDYISFPDANYNGVISQFNHIVFSGRFYYNAADNLIYKINYSVSANNTGDADNNSPASKILGVGTTEDDILKVVRYFDYSNYYFESRRFRSEPQSVVTVIDKYRGRDNITDLSSYIVGTFVQPTDTIDLWENPQFRINENYPKTLTNYLREYNNTYIFDQTIRRSNVIADESLENSWRKFETDQYINIKENKGNIMNLCTIGNIFLVHTKHSLFQFDFNDRLTSNGGVVEVDQKDIFESRYTELFNTELGFGGLQERRAAIAGDFGYIWFNNDFNHFFALSKEGPKVLSEDIDVRLKLIKPKNVRFGDDKQRSRLLIRYENGDTIETISFNYKLGCFVSMHDYDNPAWFAYTKDRIFVVNTDKIRVGHFNSTKFVDSQFSIIVNYSYDEIKFLEYLSYKFTRITDIANLAVIDFINLPVEGRYVEESGNYLYVVSDKCRTGQLLLKRTDTYDNDNAENKFRTNYPYFELGYFNMNKLINISGEGSRMFGNYFVFTFVVNTTNENKINFESFECSLTKIRR